MAINVLVVDAQRLFAAALTAALGAHDGLDVVDARIDTGVGAVEAAGTHRPDVAVVDCWLPDMQATAVVAMLRARVPACKVLMLSGFYDPALIEAVMDAGAVGFLLKTIELDEVAAAIADAHAGKSPVDPQRLAKLRRTLDARLSVSRDLLERFAALTPRELEILNLLNHGRSSGEIAEQLCVSAKTVANHVQHILDKTGASSRSEAMAIARNLGIVHPRPSGWMRVTGS